MENDFMVSESIIVIGILGSCYPDSCLAYAFDVPEEKIHAILDWFHQGAGRAFSDAVWILMHEQNLSGDHVREVFSFLDSMAVIEEAIGEAEEDKITIPDMGDSEADTEAFRAGYIFSSAALFHNMKIRTKSSIEEINALFSMNPAMEEWIAAMSHAGDRIDVRNKIFGEPGMEKAYEIVADFFGPEVAARLKEKEHIAKLNRSLRELPKDVGNKLVDMANRIMVPMEKGGASREEVEEAMFRALADEGLLPEGVSLELFRRMVKGDMRIDDSGVDYEAEYRKQTGEDLDTGDDTV